MELFSHLNFRSGRKPSGLAGLNPVSSMFRRILLFSPGLLFVVSYLIAIALGTLLLRMPVSTRSQHIEWVDALFTSTSAFCVTGLAVVDTGTYFSLFGQALIMFMVEVGGLGIMTFAALLFLSIGWSVSIRQRSFIQGTYSSDFTRDIRQLVVFIFAFTFFCELAGVLLLMPCWESGLSFPEKVFYSVFHSITAFCNAGFSLFPDNLARYDNDIRLNLIITTLIILGGIGFPVVRDVIHRFSRRGNTRLTLNTRLSLLASAVLLVLGTLLFWILERNFSLAGMPWTEQILASYFQSVTTRTAGFSTVDFGILGNATLLLVMIFMFVGASPGSTGGGIKTTSIGVISVVIINRIRGSEANNVLKATLPGEIVSRAITVFMSAVVFILIIVFLHMINVHGAVPLNQSRGQFMEYLFETVSAFGTVGLSTGITPGMDALGKLLTIVTMLVGRVGILTLVYIVASRRRAPSFQYAEENVLIG
jgi:trk system potassium uptake protein TrkH